LRTYAEYLDLDAEYLLRLFKAKMIQIAPVPTNLLVPRHSRFTVPLIILAVILVLGGAGFAVYYFRNLKKAALPAQEPQEAPGDITYRITTDPFRKRVYLGNKILIPGDLLGSAQQALKGPDVVLEVTGTASILSLKTPLGEQFIALGEEIEIDIDGKPGSDSIVFCSDISPNDPAQGVDIRLLLKNSTVGSGSSIDVESVPLSASGPGTNTVLFEDRRAYPFTLRVTFQDVCLFRHQVDNRENQENLYSNGAVVTMQANNRVRFWGSNVRALVFQIIADGRTYDLAKEQTSQVIARDIRWIYTPSGTYQLAVVEID
jgi:cytoskeletal protein RodZ